MMWRNVWQKCSDRHPIASVICSGQWFSLKALRDFSLMQNCSNQVHTTSTETFAFPVLMRCVGSGDLVDNFFLFEVSQKEFSKVRNTPVMSNDTYATTVLTLSGLLVFGETVHYLRFAFHQLDCGLIWMSMSESREAPSVSKWRAFNASIHKKMQAAEVIFPTGRCALLELVDGKPCKSHDGRISVPRHDREFLTHCPPLHEPFG